MTDIDRLPRIFVIGAAKAGTSSLARWLDDHPAVAVAKQKEVNFFSYDPVWANGVQWYADQFPADAIGCDASPSYLPSPAAADRLHRTQPAARIIALLRDPVERTYVHYWWLRLFGAEDREFLDVVKTELTDELTPLGCVDTSRYVTHLERWAGSFPRDQLLVADFLRLRDEPSELFREICRFAGIAEVEPESVGTAFNVSRQVRSQRLWQLGRLRGRRSWREQPKGLDRLLVRKHDRPPMEPAARAMLVDYFAPYDERLRAFWGRPVLPWEGAARPASSE